MEGLNGMLKTAQLNNWVRGFKVNARADNNLEISHLQYPDDTIVFCEADSEQLKVLRAVFVLFEATSSFMYLVNNVSEMQYLSRILGGKIGELPSAYQGMPLGAKNKSKGI